MENSSDWILRAQMKNVMALLVSNGFGVIASESYEPACCDLEEL
jgi:hypothetical protein